LYNHFKISHSTKSCTFILEFSIILLLSLTPAMSYSADVVPPKHANKEAPQVENVQADALTTDQKNANTDEFCVVDTFSYVVDWVAKAIKRIENEHFGPESNTTPEKTALVTVPSPETAIEESIIILDLTMPEIKHEGTMEVDKGQKINFPDMFSTQANKPYSKEAPSSSFGGRILMDDAELESMEQYRLNDVREAVRGAEISLEFKTN
jgi:hypothetical protein